MEKNAKHAEKAEPVSHPSAAVSIGNDGCRSQTWPSSSNHLCAHLTGNTSGGGMQTVLRDVP